MQNRAENQIDVVFIRHGATKANREHRYLGQTDEMLSAQGRRDLLSYKKQGIYPEVQQLFSSPMRRCLETAELLYPGLHPIVIPEWKEMDFGCFEYKNYEDLKFDPRYQSWIDSNGTLPFPGGESREDFMARCEKGFARMCRELGQQPTRQDRKEAITAGLMVHGGTIMALLGRYGSGDYFDYQVPTGRGYLCRITGIGGSPQVMEMKEL